MEITAKLSNLRTAPRKVRQVADLVRGKTAVQARTLLSFTVNKSAGNILKLLNSALASAKHDFQMEESNLFVSKITVDEGPKLKRWHPMSRGRAYPIIKRCSHIVLILSEITPKTTMKKEDKKIEVKKEEKVKVKKIVKKNLPTGRQAIKKK